MSEQPHCPTCSCHRERPRAIVIISEAALHDGTARELLGRALLMPEALLPDKEPQRALLGLDYAATVTPPRIDLKELALQCTAPVAETPILAPPTGPPKPARPPIVWRPKRGKR